jgi:hypothetical protein
VLRRAWDQLVPGGTLVIMDAKVPPGLSGKVVLPFSPWPMKHTMLGNPLIHPWEELAALTDDLDMTQRRFMSCYICRGVKPGGRRGRGANNRSDAASLVRSRRDSFRPGGEQARGRGLARRHDERRRGAAAE